jgi:sarcosine oxidase/L-pipecolate oxidase
MAGKELPTLPLHTTYAYWSVADEKDYHSFTQQAGFPIFMCYNVPFIYGFPSMDYPGMIKVSNHAGHSCDPDTRTVAADLGLLKATVSPWLAKTFEGKVKHDAPAIAEGCLYTMTPDEDFILDFLPSCPEILVAAGFSGHGFKMGPLIGRIMADLAINGPSSGNPYSSWLPHFRLERFENSVNGNSKNFKALVIKSKMRALVSAL